MVSGVPPGFLRMKPLLTAALAVCVLLGASPRGAAGQDADDSAVREVGRVRAGLGVASARIEDLTERRSSYGRPAVEVEGWRLLENGERWPVDQATFDSTSGMLSKYVNFDNVSRRQAGEAILPMGMVSARGDGYLNLFYPRNDLSLEGMDRYRAQGKESVYYELAYSPRPLEVPFLRPLVRILVNASTGSLYRYELAADHLGAGSLPPVRISGSMAGRISSLFLAGRDLQAILGGSLTGELVVTDLYYVRPNGWLQAVIPQGGTARPAWVVQFVTTADGKGDPPHVLFVDAVNGRVLGGE